MNAELLELIALVKTSTSPVQEVVQSYFDSFEFSVLKAEWTEMNVVERQMLIAKLAHERKRK